MSGHSKWATIKHKKGALDAKRGKLFSKITKEISVAAKQSGNPDTNPRLRLALQKAKEANMPSDNVDRAIKKGTGELPGVTYEETTYEGYGAGGVAILVDALTDNKNRTTSEVRTIFAKQNGNMAGQGSVSWIFAKKGYFSIPKAGTDEEKLMNLVLDLGAEDMKTDDENNFEVITNPRDFEKVKEGLSKNNIKWQEAEITMVPNNSIQLNLQHARQVLALVEALEDHDDVQNVYSNFDISDEIMKQIEKE
jgi:YebC/PmpR family DNA-binding regulatory protein